MYGLSQVQISVPLAVAFCKLADQYQVAGAGEDLLQVSFLRLCADEQ